MPTRLLATKFHVPVPRRQLVSRPRPLDRLSPLRTLTLLSAPAGFGKTTLLAEWIARGGRCDPDMRVAWLSLDDGDNDPSRFLTYVVAALQLAALSLRQHEDVAGFISSFTGSHRFVIDYLVEEVLQHQPDRVRNFLLRTAFLDRLTGPLWDTVTGLEGGRAMLATLERDNLFVVPLDAQRQWYLPGPCLRCLARPLNRALHRTVDRPHRHPGAAVEQPLRPGNPARQRRPGARPTAEQRPAHRRRRWPRSARAQLLRLGRNRALLAHRGRPAARNRLQAGSGAL